VKVESARVCSTRGLRLCRLGCQAQRSSDETGAGLGSPAYALRGTPRCMPL